MCDIYDVLESSYGSADEIVSTIYEYGENNLGNGVRKIAGDMLMVGQDLGYNECRDKAVPIAYDLGKGDGLIEGSIITLCATAAVAAITVGIVKLVKHIKTKKAKAQTEESVSEQTDPIGEEITDGNT